MKSSTKSTLLSLLVFPGAGYFTLNKFKQGFVFLLLSGSALGIIIYDTTYKAQIISQKIISGSLPADITLIQQEILNAPGYFSDSMISFATISLGVLWIAGAIDCYRLGKLQDNRA